MIGIPLNGLKWGAIGLYGLYLATNCRPIDRTQQIIEDLVPDSPRDLVPFVITEQSLSDRYAMLIDTRLEAQKYGALETKIQK